MAEPISVAWLAPELHPEHPLGAYLDDTGKLAVWVNASPDHPVHGGGWFESYIGKPGEYRPQRPADPAEVGYLNHDKAEADLA